MACKSKGGKTTKKGGKKGRQERRLQEVIIRKENDYV